MNSCMIGYCDDIEISFEFGISHRDDPARCAEICNKLADELEERNRNGVSVFEKGTKRIMFTGTPMAIPNWKLHHIVETSGGAVVCEEMCTGTRLSG